jgi:hypothetical protein|tara:strand:+ start:1179 stop:1583 length:405 start_codon:yes stop_codon:yes gene_type:complete
MAEISDNTNVAMPIRNMVSIIIAVAVATWAYFGIIERLNSIETEQTLMTSDLEKNTEFRIKWPRGDMGSLPADAEQFMLIEHIAGQLEKLTQNIETGKAPYDQQQKLTLDFYETRIKKLEGNLDKLKDKIGQTK